MNSTLVLATGNLVLGGLVFLLGLVILRENPRQQLNRVVSSMLFFGGLGSIILALGILSDRATAAERLRPGFQEDVSYLWEFFFPTLFLFASTFPRDRGFIRRFPRFGFLVYAPHAVHFVLLIGITVFFRDPASGIHAQGGMRLLVSLLDVTLSFFLAVHRALFSLVNLGFGVASALLLFASYREARVPRLRQQLGTIAFGLGLSLVLYSAASSIPTLLNVGLSPATRSLLTIAALTVASGAIAFSMVRHKFLDAKLLARRGILYALASAALVGFYLAVVVRVNRLLAAMSGIDERVFEPVVLVIGLILFQPVISRLEDWLEQLFLHDPGDYRNVLRRLRKELQTSIDLEQMLDTSIRTIADALLVRSASVVALPRDEAPIVYVGAGDPPPPESLARLPEILHGLEAGRESFRVDEPVPGIDEQQRGHLTTRFGAVLLFPLESKGETVGAILLGPKETGTEFTADDVALLGEVAGQMAISLQNGLLLRERVRGARIEEELNLAREIQSKFLPSEFPAFDRFEVYGVNTPSRHVGGDYFDLVPGGDGSIFLAIADVSGKGVPAALLTSMLQASLRTQADTTTSVSEILGNMNGLVHSRTTDEQFATFFLARIETDSLGVSFCNAGHNHPLLFRNGGGVDPLARGGLMLGMFSGIDFEEGSVDLRAGDRIVLYTDGVTEAQNRAGEEFGEERLEALIQTLPAELSAREMTERIVEDLRGFLEGQEPQDDVTLLVLRVREPVEASAERDREPTLTGD